MKKERFIMIDGEHDTELIPAATMQIRGFISDTPRPVPKRLYSRTSIRAAYSIEIVLGYGFEYNNRWVVYSTKQEAEKHHERIRSKRSR